MQYVPDNLEWAILYECELEVEQVCQGIDYAESHYRKYLSGVHKNLRRVNGEVRWLRRCKLYNKELLYRILNLVENDIIKYELYELMPRHLSAKEKLLKLKI